MPHLQDVLSHKRLCFIRMSHKIWHKPLHQRKVWRQMTLISKIIYYMQPFLEHMLDTWLQPLPFPTILKFVYSCLLAVFILLPILYPSAVLLCAYAELQFILERHAGIKFFEKVDLLRYVERLFKHRVNNEKHSLFILMYMDRWRLLGTAVASSIDYMRLALCLLFGN